jgi:hypothetical protein
MKKKEEMLREIKWTIKKRGEDSGQKKRWKGNEDRMAIERRPGWRSLVFTSQLIYT